MSQSKITTGASGFWIGVMMTTVTVLSLSLYVWVEVSSVPCAPEVSTVPKRVPLPRKCAEYYNDGTGRWAECMGVGKK